MVNIKFYTNFVQYDNLIFVLIQSFYVYFYVTHNSTVSRKFYYVLYIIIILVSRFYSCSYLHI